MTTELYGGAITITKLPDSFIDISQIRQVPDTQEVFINQLTSNSESFDQSFDQSFIIDLLERVDCIDYQEAINLHLQDIVPPNVYNHPIEEKINQDGIIRYFSFVKFIPHYNNKKINSNNLESPKQIITLICLIRLENVDTDVLLQYIIPLKDDLDHDNEDGDGDDNADGEEDVNFEKFGSTKVDKIVKESYKLFKEIALSFTIKNWNLFA